MLPLNVKRLYLGVALRSLNTRDILDDTDDNADEDADDDDENEDRGDTGPDDAADTNTDTDNIEVVGERIPHSNLFWWKFPGKVSRSTLDGRNGSSACSIIALIFPHGTWSQGLDLQLTPLLSL